MIVIQTLDCIFCLLKLIQLVNKGCLIIVKNDSKFKLYIFSLKLIWKMECKNSLLICSYGFNFQWIFDNETFIKQNRKKFVKTNLKKLFTQFYLNFTSLKHYIFEWRLEIYCMKCVWEGVSACKHKCVCTLRCACMSACVLCVCVGVRIFVHICVCIMMCVCVWLCSVCAYYKTPVLQINKPSSV